MLEETTPRTSSKWVPHSTFAADMGFTEYKGTPEIVQHVEAEKDSDGSAV